MALQQSIIYLSRQGFGYYSSSRVLWFAFPQTSVKDLDVINKTELVNSIEMFIDKNQIAKASCFMILSEHVYFEKDYIGALDQQEILTQAFADTVPFENVLKKTFPIENGFKVVAANKDLCLCIRQAFWEKGFVFEAITPALIVGSQVVENENGLIQESIDLLFQKIAVFRQNGFSLDEQTAQTKIASQPFVRQTTSSQNNNSKIIWLLSAFFILLLILAGLLSGRFF
ncbi:MAG: hypothetical protein HYV37_03160 [Candidatus Levyibacteriota bacterium]|nr:MAG: hypothetical protein HYV37_03160 [Candidatus Levybacteria bacterium]